MARDTVFETREVEKPNAMSSDVVRTTLTPGDTRGNTGLPGMINNPRLNVQNIERPRRGHGY